jgi:hypothetical protein
MSSDADSSVRMSAAAATMNVKAGKKSGHLKFNELRL